MRSFSDSDINPTDVYVDNILYHCVFTEIQMFKLHNNDIKNNIFIPNTATAAAHNNNVYNMIK